MRDAVYFGIDLLECLIQGTLFLSLFRELLSPAKGERRRGRTELLFLLQFTAVRMLMHYLPAWKRFLYGPGPVPGQSRLGIVPVLVSMGLSLVYCLCFYAGNRGRICYLVFIEYTLCELVRFFLFPFFTGLLNLVTGYITLFIENGNALVLAHISGILQAVQLIWNLLFVSAFLIFLYVLNRFLKRHLRREQTELGILEHVFLLIPGMTGLCFCVLLRTVLYSYDGKEILYFTDTYPDAHIWIPLISLLCMASILLSVLVLERLIENSEKELLLEIYRNRITDMEGHMKDVEHLYDGIRGMKHDMKNYLADIEALLREGENERDEVRRYLDGLYHSMEELDMKCRTGNPVTDVVISRKMREAEAEYISFTNEFYFPEGLGISAFDLSIILNNILENAMEAVKKEKGERTIRLESYRRENMFFIEAENTCTGMIKTKTEGGIPATTKEEKDGHGFGMKNVANCVEKYQGQLSCDYKNRIFSVTIMMQGRLKEENI